MKYEYTDETKQKVRRILELGDKGYKKPESGYWVRVPEKWWREAMKGLKPIERCLLISLRIWGALRPSKSQLARELGVTRKTVVKYLKKLKIKKLL